MFEKKCAFCGEARDDLVFRGAPGYEARPTVVAYWACPEGEGCYEERHMAQEERTAALKREFLQNAERQLLER